MSSSKSVSVLAELAEVAELAGPTIVAGFAVVGGAIVAGGVAMLAASSVRVALFVIAGGILTLAFRPLAVIYATGRIDFCTPRTYRRAA